MNGKMRNRLCLLIRLTLLLGSSLILTSAHPLVEPIGFTATTLIDYVPAMPDAVKTGYCWSHSQVVPASNTWRCGSEDRVVHDPCFAVRRDESVVCGANPAQAQTGFVLNLTRPLPEVTLPGKTVSRPTWLVELADGTLCAPTTGGTFSFGNARLRYACENDTYILGDLKPGSVWRAEQIVVVRTPDEFSAGNKRSHAVRRVWRVAESVTPSLREADLQNAVYHLDEIQIKLTDGKYEQHFADGAGMPLAVTLLDQGGPQGIVYADLNQDGAEDAVVLLAKSGGAGGELIYAAAVLNLDGEPYNVVTQLLGDRVDVHTVQVDDGRITFVFRNIGPGDAACCGSQIVRKVFTLRHDGASRAAAYRMVEQSTEVLIPSFLDRLQNAAYNVPGFKEPVVLASGHFTGTIETQTGAQKVTAYLAKHESFSGRPEVVRTLGALRNEPDASLALATVLVMNVGVESPVYHPVLLLEDERHQVHQLAIAQPEENLRVRAVYISEGRVELHADTLGPGDTSRLPTQQVKLVYAVRGNQLIRETREVVVDSIRQRLEATTFKISGDVDGNGNVDTAALLASPSTEDALTYELVILDEQAERLFSTFLGYVRPGSIQIQEGALTVEMDELGKGDDPCCPSQQVRARFDVVEGALIELGSRILVPPYEERLKQGAFPSQWSDAPIQLIDGRFAGEVSVAGTPTRLSASLASNSDPTSSVLFGAGDLDGDGADEAAVILVVNPGDGDTVHELAVIAFEDGRSLPVASVPLGENLCVQSLAIDRQQIKLELTRYNVPNTEQVAARTYELQDNGLVRVEE